MGGGIALWEKFISREGDNVGGCWSTRLRPDVRPRACRRAFGPGSATPGPEAGPTMRSASATPTRLSHVFGAVSQMPTMWHVTAYSVRRNGFLI